MKKYDTVIFDLDGTLLDTLEDLKDSVNFVLQSHGFSRKSMEEVKLSIGNGTGHLIELTIPDGRNNPQYEECLAEFRMHYSLNMQNKTAPYKGIMEILKKMSSEGYKLAIVSNKFDQAVRRLNQAYFREYITVAIGPSENVSKKPAPEMVWKALEELKSVADKALYVGDSEVDVETAENAGIMFVGVAWGYRDRVVLAAKGAVCIIDRPEELFDILAG